MDGLNGKTFFISGASRGIGKAIALRLAEAGANIVIAAKSIVENEKLGGTIFTAAEAVEKHGGQALAVACDIRDEAQIAEAMRQTIERFGRLDGVVNNASAIHLSPTVLLEPKRYDLMMDINVRGTFMVTQAAVRLMKNNGGGHVLTLSPPLPLKPEWLAPYPAYALSKFSMSLLSAAWAKELAKDRILVNTLWPVTTIATAAVRNILGGEGLIARSRYPEIVADAAYFILKDTQPENTGQHWLDEDILRKNQIEDFEKYAVTPGGELQRDIFI